MEAANRSHFKNRQLWEMSAYSLDQCREAIELLQRRIKQLTNADYLSYMDKEIKDLGLSVRAYNVLMHKNLKTIGDIINYGLENIGYLPYCGIKTSEEIREIILKDLPE